MMSVRDEHHGLVSVNPELALIILLSNKVATGQIFGSYTAEI